MRKSLKSFHEQLEDIKAISKPIRLKILVDLYDRSPDPVPFTYLKKKLRINSNSLTKQLKTLIDNGLVENFYVKRRDFAKCHSFYKLTKKGIRILNSRIVLPKVWEILDLFKDVCRSKGWETSEHEDWIKTDDEYHNFLWVQAISPATFHKVAKDHYAAIRRAASYRVVEVSYTAWLFAQTQQNELVQTISDNPELSRRTAVYDLSWAYVGKPVCFKLNKTNSKVFEEFERFLNERWGVEVKPLTRRK